MSLGQIVNNISNTVGSFGGFVSAGRRGPYTQYEGVTNRIIPGNWRLSLPYSLKVVGVSSPTFGSNTPLSGIFDVIGTPAGGGLFDEFFFPIAPSAISQDEIFAINVTPTQRGIVTEHNGVVFKELMIKGTTGQRPKINNKSGYEYFLELRNYLRSYAELKKDPKQRNCQLIFLNRKDNEYLVVEPVRFKMDRTAQESFLYRYEIALKVLGSVRPNFSSGKLQDFFNSVDSYIEQATDLILGARDVFQTFQQSIVNIQNDFVSTIAEPIEAISLTFKSFTGASLTLADMPSSIGNQLSDRTIKAFLDQAKIEKNNGNPNFANINLPINTAAEARAFGYSALNILPVSAKNDLSLSFLAPSESKMVADLANEGRSNTRLYYQDLLNTIKQSRDNFIDQYGYGSTYYNNFVGRSSYTSSPNNPEYFDSEENSILKAFYDLNKGLNLVLSTNDLFKGDVEQYTELVRSNYDSQLEVFTPQSVDEIILPDNKSLEDLATQYLGSAERWINIAIVNNLEYPYIDSSGTLQNTLAPGDKILIPRITPPDISNIPNTPEIFITQNLSETERNLGVDIRVDKDNQTFDFIIGNNNDVQLVAVGDNAAQAVIIKLALDKGSLKYHPEIGVGLNIGEKINQGIDVRDQIVVSVLSDPRFDNIKDFSFSIDGSTISIYMTLIVKNLIAPVPLTLKV